MAKAIVDKRRLVYSNVALALAVLEGGAVVEVAVVAVVVVDSGVTSMCMLMFLYAWGNGFRTVSSHVHSKNANRKVNADCQLVRIPKSGLDVTNM